MDSAIELDVRTNEKTNVTHNKANPPAYMRLFPANAAELDEMLSQAETTPTSQLIPAAEGFKALEERLL